MTNPDPFWVRWEVVGAAYQWHAHDADGQGIYYVDRPEPQEDGFWAIPDGRGDGDAYMIVFDRRDLTGLDWRESLRRRPEPV